MFFVFQLLDWWIYIDLQSPLNQSKHLDKYKTVVCNSKNISQHFVVIKVRATYIKIQNCYKKEPYDRLLT